MDLGIAGRVALVTGASKGLGFGIARALVAEGVAVAVSSRSPERAADAAAAIGGRGFAHDASDVEGAARLAGEVATELGPIDILVANSGGPPASPDALSFTHDQWRSAYDTLLLGQMALIEAVLPGMRERRWGRILSVSSLAAREPIPQLMLSNAHRAGLLAALKTIARQVAGDGVTVNALLPGLIATDRARELGGADRVQEIPAQRMGTVEEFGATAAFLCSQSAAYITGTTVLIDGGASRAI